MAGAGYKLFNTGDVLTAAQVNTYLQEQTVMVFADATARTTALSGVLAEGMVTYLKDTDAVEKYNGSAWVSIGGSASPLTTKGDLYTYSTTDARLAVGNNGETLVADSSATTGLRWQGDYAAGKNKIINGDFFINQRNFSSDTSTFAYGFDRWAYYYVSGTTTYSAQTFTTGAAPVAGYEARNFARMAVTGQTGGTAQAVLYQNIEDVRTFAGQTALGLATRTGKNVICGHTHRQGIASASHGFAGKLSTLWGMEVGHLCDLNSINDITFMSNPINSVANGGCITNHSVSRSASRNRKRRGRRR